MKPDEALMVACRDRDPDAAWQAAEAIYREQIDAGQTPVQALGHVVYVAEQWHRLRPHGYRVDDPALRDWSKR